jgi:hypothetical protein
MPCYTVLCLRNMPMKGRERLARYE